MSIPKYTEIIPFLLQKLVAGKEYHISEFYLVLADDFKLTEEERQRWYESGSANIFEDRVNWAKSELKLAGYIEYPRRSQFVLTQKGKDAQSWPHSQLLSTIKEEMRQREKAKQLETSTVPEESEEKTPIDLIEEGHATLKEALKAKLLEQILQASPDFFEDLVVKLLVKMGYGGSVKDAGQAIGRSGDGGIDGVIKEDFLGLDIIYLQAKRWKGKVGSPEIQGFSGALDAKRAQKGVFITTSAYTAAARDFVKQSGKRLILIDGNQLAELMIEYNVGVNVEKTYTVKNIDIDFFEEQ